MSSLCRGSTCRVAAMEVDPNRGDLGLMHRGHLGRIKLKWLNGCFRTVCTERARGAAGAGVGHRPGGPGVRRTGGTVAGQLKWV